jgi:hypothetical protein
MAPSHPIPSDLQADVFLVRDARRRGLSADSLRRESLARPIRGVRVSAEHAGLSERLTAYAIHRQRDFAFSHVTAAVLYGIPLPSYHAEEIHVSVPDPGRAPNIAGYVGHKLKRWAVREVAGFPVTTPEQTWLDLAPTLDHEALVVAGDFLVSGQPLLTDRAALREAISASSGRRGVGRARVALERVRTGAESPGETRLRLLLVDAGLPEPQLNHRILDRDGTFVARADLVYTGARIAIEYEGDVHRLDTEVWRRDIRRRERVEDLGWRMVRVTADDLRSPVTLVSRIRHLLRTRLPHPSPR